jgi:glycosyltransferase involved in cell wall biosynthesis
MSFGRVGPSKVDVVILTKNSLRPSLPETIESVYANVPVNRLIVVDGGSTDGTVDFVANQRNVLLIDDSNGNRATARQKGIENVETPVFAFVDSDIILQKNWFAEALALLGPKVGAISTYPRYYGTAGSVQKALERMYGRPTRRRFDTAAALLRVEPLRGVRIPKEDEQVPSEDEFIGRTLERRGYQVLSVERPIAYHRESPHLDSRPERVRDLMTKGRLLKSKGWRTGGYMARQFLLSIPEGLFVWLYTGDLKAGRQRIADRAVTFYAFMTAPEAK